MRGGTATLVRWALLCAVAFGVLGMHHLAAPSTGGHAGGHSAIAVARDCCPVEEPITDHGGGHDLVAHLCLAVLAAAVGLGLLLVLLGRRGDPPPPRAWSRSGRAHARPPPPTSVRLAMLCVLRQ